MKRQERSPSPMPVVPRRPRSVLRTRAGDAWLEAAKRPRLGNGSGRPARRQGHQAQALDIESDRELDVAEALFDLANVAVAFSEQADSAETRPPHDVPQRHHDKLRRSQVKSRPFPAYDEAASPRTSCKPHSGGQGFARGHRFHKHPASVSHRSVGRPSYGSSGPEAMVGEAAGPSQALSVPKPVKAARPMVSLDAQLPVDAPPPRAGLGSAPPGHIAAFFPGGNLPRGPYQDLPGGTGPRPGAADVDSPFLQGDACAQGPPGHSATRRPLKHCALHVYIAQFIDFHMRRAKAKEEDHHSRSAAYSYLPSHRLEGMDVAALEGRLPPAPGLSLPPPASSTQGQLGSRKPAPAGLVKSESGSLPNGHSQPAQNGYSGQNAQATNMPQSLLSFTAQQASAAPMSTGHFGGSAPPNSGAARMVSSALAALGPQYGLPSVHIMQPPAAFPFLAHGNHLAGSPPPPFGPLPPGLTPQQVASLAAMGSLFGPGGPHGPPLQPLMQAAGSFPAQLGSSLPSHLAAAAASAPMPPPHSHPTGPLLGPHPRLEMQGEHSPAEPGTAPPALHRRPPAASTPLPEGSGSLRSLARPAHMQPDALQHLRHLGLPAGVMAASGHPLPPGLAEQIMAAAQQSSVNSHSDARRSSIPLLQ